MNYVVGFLFSEDQKQVVLVKKKRPQWQAGFYNGVGGKVEYAETFSNAMLREFQEETGVQTLEEDWDLYAEMEGEKFKIKIFCCFNDLYLSQVTTKTDEQIEIVPVELDKLRTTAISNCSWLIGAALDPDRFRFLLRTTYLD